MRVTRPVLRYHGGKWKLAPWIISHFPEHRVYVEPFGGGASVLLRKKRSYAEIYNDLDGELVNLFTVVRDRGGELIDKLKATPFARKEYRLSFDMCEDPLEQARRTAIRSFMGFGSNALCRAIQSGFRSNSNRSGTTPAHDWVNYLNTLKPIIDRLMGVVLEHRDAAEIIMRHDSRDALHYCDPPYPHETRSALMHGNHGYNYEMTTEQHREIATVLRSVKGMVVVSGYPCDLYDRELYSDWQRVEVPHLADGARKRTEVLWLNESAASQMPQDYLQFNTRSASTPNSADGVGTQNKVLLEQERLKEKETIL
jgi:DNA adenine methylase